MAQKKSNKNPIVSIIMGSDSDLPIMKSSAEILYQFGVPYEITVLSAHRTPEKAAEYAKGASSRGIKVIIAAAGGAAHLAGVVASLTTIPVIGVPIKSSHFNGLDSLLSIVQMPEGIPVATVALNGAKNAALLALRILSLSDSALHKKMVEYRSSLKQKVLDKAKKLESIGYKDYLKQLA